MVYDLSLQRCLQGQTALTQGSTVRGPCASRVGRCSTATMTRTPSASSAVRHKLAVLCNSTGGTMTAKHTQQQYAAMLRAAEAGLDDMERMLGVARLMLTFCTDLLCRRHEEEPALVLNNILEAHHINRFPVNNVAGTLPSADAVVHEVCSPDEQIYFQVCFSSTQPGTESGMPLASLQMVLQPDAQCKSSRFGNSKSIQIKLYGHCTIHLEAPHETYTIQLPNISVKDMQSPFRAIDLTGKLAITCAASELSLQISFEAKHAVSGQVFREVKGKQHAVVRIMGSWSERIGITSQVAKTREAAWQGVLFKNQQPWGCGQASVDIQQPSLMKLAGLWLCIKEALQHSNLPARLQPLSTQADSRRTGLLKFGLEYSLTGKHEGSIHAA